MNQHDNIYKLLFSEPQMIVDLLQGFVHEPWVENLDFSSLEKVADHYVSDDLRSREDDVIWRVKCQDEWLYVYLLIEFQSSVDRFMAVRLMTYIGLLYQDLIKSQKFKKQQKLPPVFPVVLYNGKRRWTAKTQLSELIADLPKNISHYKPSLHYLVLDEGRFSQDELNPLKNLVAAVFRLENAITHEDMIKVVDDLLEWLKAPEQESLRRHFTLWIKRVLRSSKTITEPIENLHELTEVKAMLAETVKNWPKKWKAEGKVEGKVEGKAEGIQETKLATAKAMLQKGLDLELIVEITGLSKEAVLQLMH
jgi:predicted transposase/invertase (TIGR01784 family)